MCFAMPDFSSSNVFTGVFVLALGSPKSAARASAVLRFADRWTMTIPSTSRHSIDDPGVRPSARRTAIGTDTWPCDVSLLWTVLMHKNINYYRGNVNSANSMRISDHAVIPDCTRPPKRYLPHPCVTAQSFLSAAASGSLRAQSARHALL